MPFVKITFTDKEKQKLFVSYLIEIDTIMFSVSYDMVLLEFYNRHHSDIEKTALSIDSNAEIERKWRDKYKEGINSGDC